MVRSFRAKLYGEKAQALTLKINLAHPFVY